MKNKITLVIMAIFALSGCGGGGDSSNDEYSQNNNSTEKNQYLTAGIYQAVDGRGYSDFYTLKLEQGGYLDITKFHTKVSLYSTSLELIDNNLETTDYIKSGEYKIKFAYEATSLTPGSVTIFSLELKKYSDLTEINPGVYSGSGSLGRYSVYYRLNMISEGFIDITTTKSSVYIYNKTAAINDGMPLSSHFEKVTGNKHLDAGEYIIKFTYDSTSLTPGTVSFKMN